MKKQYKSKSSFVSVLLTIALLVSMLAVPVVAGAQESTASADVAPVEIVDSVFEDASGTEMDSITSGSYRGVTYLKADASADVVTAVAVYNGQKLSDVSYASDKVIAGGNILRTGYVNVAEGERVKLLTWTNGTKPVALAVADNSLVLNTVESAVLTVGSASYNGDINRIEKTITFDVPLKYGTYKSNNSLIDDVSNLEAVKLSVNGSYSSVSPDLSSTVNLTAPKTINVTDKNGNTDEYTVIARNAVWGRNYDFDGAEYDDGSISWNKDLRVGAPRSLSTDTGDGVWLYASGSLADNLNTITLVRDENNDYLNITKTADEEGNGKTFALWSTGNLATNTAYSAEFSMRINSLTGKLASGDFMTVNSSVTDDIIISAKGASEGHYRIGHRSNGTGSIDYVPGIEIPFGEWHTIRYVYKENAVPVSGAMFDGYIMELYLDGKLIDQFCHGVSSKNAAYSGSLKYVGSVTWINKPQIAFNPYLNAFLSVDIDNVKVVAVPRSSDASLASASLTVNGTVYNGDINTARNTVIFEIPEEEATDANILAGKLSIVTGDSDATYKMSDAALTSAQTLTVIAPNGTEASYTVSVEPYKVMRTYDAEGGVTVTDNTPTELAGSISAWALSAKTNAAVSMIEETSGNHYIKFAKKADGAGYTFGSAFKTSPSNNNETGYNADGLFVDKASASVRLMVDTTGIAANTSFATIRSSYNDELILRTDANGNYIFRKRNRAQTSDSEIVNSPVLESGKWYTVKYVYHRYGEYDVNTADWYSIAIYVDGVFVDEIQQPAPTATAWKFTGSGRYTASMSNYGQIIVSLFAGFPAKSAVCIDDLNVTYIDFGTMNSSSSEETTTPEAVLASGDVYDITLNSVSKEATVEIPYTTASYESKAIDGKAWPQIHLDASEAVIYMPTGMKGALNGSGDYASAFVCNLNDTNTLSIKNENDEAVTYNLTCDYTESLASDDAGEVSSGSTYSLTAESVPANYTCKQVNASAKIKLTSFANGEEVTLSVLGCDIAKITSENGVVSMASDYGSLAENALELNKEYLVSAEIIGTKANIYLDGIYIGSVDYSGTLTAVSDAMTLTATGNATVSVSDANVNVINSILDDKTVVHVLGDSIVQYYGNDVSGVDKNIEGWGRYFCDLFNEDTVVLNHARSGYNTNVYLNGTDRTGYETHERWSSIKSGMKAGDYLVIFLAWNEENSVDGTKTEEAYTANMNKLISDAKALGVTPIVITPGLQSNKIWTVTDEATGETIYKSALENVKSTWAGYIRNIAEANSIVCLDLNKDLFENCWQDAYHRGVGGFNNTAEGWAAAIEVKNTYFYDTLHVNRAGAQFYCDRIKLLLENSDSELKNCLKSE